MESTQRRSGVPRRWQERRLLANPRSGPPRQSPPPRAARPHRRAPRAPPSRRWSSRRSPRARPSTGADFHRGCASAATACGRSNLGEPWPFGRGRKAKSGSPAATRARAAWSVSSCAPRVRRSAPGALRDRASGVVHRARPSGHRQPTRPPAEAPVPSGMAVEHGTKLGAKRRIPDARAAIGGPMNQASYDHQSAQREQLKREVVDDSAIRREQQAPVDPGSDRVGDRRVGGGPSPVGSGSFAKAEHKPRRKSLPPPPPATRPSRRQRSWRLGASRGRRAGNPERMNG